MSEPKHTPTSACCVIIVKHLQILILLVQEASLTYSGSYACHASVGIVSQVMVHVIRSK